MKEAEHIGDAGSLASDPAQRNSAADGGTIADRPLAPEEADRYALAFRPSWAPLGVEPQESAKSTKSTKSTSPARSARPVASPMARRPADASAPVENGRAQEDLLQRLGRRSRVRSLALAGLSVLSFFMLGYWAISSTTDTSTAVRRLPTPSFASPPNTVPEAAASPAGLDPQGSTTAPLPSARLSARLSDPTEPAAPANATGTPGETADEATAAGSDPAQPELPAEAPAEAIAQTAAAAAAPTEATLPSAGTTEAAHTEPPQPTTARLAATTPPATEAPGLTPTPTAVAAAVPTTAPTGASPSETRPATVPSLAQSPTRPAPVPAAPTAPAVVSRQPAQPAPAAPAAPADAKSSAAAPKLAAAPAATTTVLPAPDKPRSPQLVVHALPDSAQLWLDGQRMSNPFDTHLPLGSKHKIEARHEGFETSSQSIRLEADARLTITLRRTAPPPAPPIKVRPPADAPRGAGFVTSNPY